MFLKIYRYKGSDIKDWYIANGRDKKGRYLHGFGRTHYEALKDALKK